MRKLLVILVIASLAVPTWAQVAPDASPSPTPPPSPSITDQTVIPTTVDPPYDGPVMSTRPPISYPQSSDSPGETNPANDLPLPGENFPETEMPNSPAVPTMIVP
jgi:hypothetical protein